MTSKIVIDKVKKAKLLERSEVAYPINSEWEYLLRIPNPQNIPSTTPMKAAQKLSKTSSF
ncbi:MAG: hypothetical protein LBV77_02215 [Candidatus Adiutrix intracellularis]|jgi:hypothetical protein|nr:hypothetical protein [Candidatus Adiutrix intracellularis]